MSSLNKWFTGALICAVAGYLFFSSSTWRVHGVVHDEGMSGGTVVPAVSSSQVRVVPALPSSTAVQSRSSPSTTQPQTPGGIGLASELLKAGNLRVFAESAKRQPQSGGYFYASMAARSCNQTAGLWRSNGRAASRTDADQRASEAMEALRRLCSDFTVPELQAAYLELHQQGLMADDPLIRLADKWAAVRAKGDAPESSLVSQMLDTQDPVWLSSQSPGLMAVFSNAADGRRVPQGYFAGQWFDGDAQRMLEAAWVLLPCVAGLDCGPGNYQVVVSCAGGAGCAANLADVISAQYFGGDAKQTAASQALSKRLWAAVQARDATAFVPPPPKP
ncbi:MAG: hypothetical protein IPJ08_23905 [Burkholderiales bacterium]|nr:hypothetical protein [Burkholderiales bacterium]